MKYFFPFYSLLSHKEFRFILPIVPMAMMICGKGMDQMATASLSTNMKKHDDNNSTKTHHLSFKGKLLAVFLILTNILVSLFTGLIHQRGTLDVMRALEEKIKHVPNTSVLFLMPCHSTPYYRYVIMKTQHKSFIVLLLNAGLFLFLATSTRKLRCDF